MKMAVVMGGTDGLGEGGGSGAAKQKSGGWFGASSPGGSYASMSVRFVDPNAFSVRTELGSRGRPNSWKSQTYKRDHIMSTSGRRRIIPPILEPVQH